MTTTPTTTEVVAVPAIPEQFVDVISGEVLPASLDAAARALLSIRLLEDKIKDVRRGVTDWVAEQSRINGTKTFHAAGADVTFSGGVSSDYDEHTLRAALLDAGCPDERVDEAIVPTVEYKVNRTVLRQLAGANPAYAAAIASALVEKISPPRATVKPRRTT